MKNKSQKQRVVGVLMRDGRITRNMCLNNYISRLSAIIQELEEEGWEFETKKVKGDYAYTVTKSPYKKVVYFVPELNKEITTQVK